MDRALYAICALLLNAAFGGPRQFYEKLGILRILNAPGRMLRDVERKLNREHRSVAERVVRGWIVVIMVVACSFLLAWLCNALLAVTTRFLELLLLACLLPMRSHWDVASKVRQSLGANNVAQARQAFEGTPWRHHALLDEHGVARAAIEMLAVCFSEKILSPVLWYLLFGLPGLFVTVSINLLHESMATADNPFGKAARTLHTLTHWLPSRVAAGLWLLASLFLTEGKMRDYAKPLWNPILEDAPSELILHTAAIVLKISLGGPVSIYAGGKWIGSGTPKVGSAHLKKALYLFAVLHLLLVIILGLVL